MVWFEPETGLEGVAVAVTEGVETRLVGAVGVLLSITMGAVLPPATTLVCVEEIASSCPLVVLVRCWTVPLCDGVRV